MVDAQARVALEGVPPVFPEGVDALLRMQLADGVGPALGEKVRIGFPDLRAEQRIVAPALRRINVEIRRHDIEIADQRGGKIEGQKVGRVGLQPLEPTQLVVEFGTWRRIAVRQVEAADQDAVDGGLDIAAVAVVGIAGQAAARQDRGCIPGEDRDTVPTFLSMPDGLVSHSLKFAPGKALVRRFEFLQADDVGRVFFQPSQKDWKPAVDAVDVVGGEFHEAAPGGAMVRGKTVPELQRFPAL